MTSTRRVIPLALAALVTATAAVALLVSGKTEAAATPAHEHGAIAAHHDHAGISARELALRSTMDRLWQEHVVWTRLAIISLTTGAPDTKETVARLLRNQTDLGNAVKPFYGAAAGKQLTALLREHILIAADLIAVAQKGDGAGVSAQQARWTKNADQIADFLSAANPRNWRQGEMRHMMHEHLRLTTNEVVARLKQEWTADVKAYDRVEREILHMSEMLADGLV
ncbi:MAG TPA: hypothetical protein VIQ56_08140, partial [Gaiella sp.]